MSKQAVNGDFVIWGPSVGAGRMALNAVHALYFLPQRFKLVLPAVLPGQQALYRKVRSLIERDELSGRVRFTDRQVTAARQAVIVATATDKRPGSIFGGTPEALASAILRASRSAD